MPRAPHLVDCLLLGNVRTEIVYCSSANLPPEALSVI